MTLGVLTPADATPEELEQLRREQDEALRDRKMVFVAQIDCEATPPPDPAFPGTGWLYLFMGLVADQGVEVFVAHHEGPREVLQERRAALDSILPNSIGSGAYIEPRRLEATPGLSLPASMTDLPKAVDDNRTLADAYFDILAELDGPPNKRGLTLGGWPSGYQSTLFQDAKEVLGGDDWIMLFEVHSVADIGLGFGIPYHAGGRLVFPSTLAVLIRRGDLAGRNFERVFANTTL